MELTLVENGDMSWSLPNTNWLKLNIDGACDQELWDAVLFCEIQKEILFLVLYTNTQILEII